MHGERMSNAPEPHGTLRETRNLALKFTRAHAPNQIHGRRDCGQSEGDHRESEGACQSPDRPPGQRAPAPAYLRGVAVILLRSLA